MKQGDRVWIEWQDEGRYVGATVAGPCDVIVDGRKYKVPFSALTVLAPPVNVDDRITTSEQVDALPSGTVVSDWRGHICRKRDGGDWDVTGYATPYGLLATPARVLWLPDTDDES